MGLVVIVFLFYKKKGEVELTNKNKVIDFNSKIENEKVKENEDEEIMIEFEEGKCRVSETIFYVGTTFGLERIVRLFSKDDLLLAIDKVYGKGEK